MIDFFGKIVYDTNSYERKKSKVTLIKAYFVLFLLKKTDLSSDCSRE